MWIFANQKRGRVMVSYYPPRLSFESLIYRALPANIHFQPLFPHIFPCACVARPRASLEAIRLLPLRNAPRTGRRGAFHSRAAFSERESIVKGRRPRGNTCSTRLPTINRAYSNRIRGADSRTPGQNCAHTPNELADRRPFLRSARGGAAVHGFNSGRFGLSTPAAGIALFAAVLPFTVPPLSSGAPGVVTVGV
jgi:hypothetical protein